MAINKVIYGGDTLIDLTSDSVTPPKLKIGATAHSANGSIIDGELAGVYYGTAQPSSADTKVWIDPSGDNINIKYQIYNSVTDLGLTSGSATIAGAYSAMAIPSILICPAGDFTDVPHVYGTVEIVKVGVSRGYIRFWGKGSDSGEYRMYLSSDNLPTGTWVRETEIQYRDYTMSVSLSGKTYTAVSNSNITVPTGFMIINIVLWTGSTTSLRNDVVMSVANYGNHNNFLFFNNNSSSLSGTVTLRVFYSPTVSLN